MKLRQIRTVIVVLAIAALGLPVGVATGAPENGSGRSSAASSEGSAALLAERSIRDLRQAAKGAVFVSMRKSTDVAGFVRTSRRGDLLPATSATTPAAKARDYFARFGGAFGIRDASQLVETSRTRDAYGSTHLTYAQVYRGVSVFGAELRVHLDARMRLTSVNGVFVPELNLGTAPTLSAAQAARRAVNAVVADPPVASDGTVARVSASDLLAAARLVVYRTGLVRDVAGSNQLAYEVEVTNGSSIRDFLYVHAHAGKVLNRYSAIDNALHRVLYEMDPNTEPVWEEGDPFPGTLNEDQQNIVNASGDSYWFYFNAFGRDSYDGAGAMMRSVNNDPTIACPNANWNGATTNYCNGVTADDVVAHEWTHAYTQFTHNLIYQWQSGALNEAYSDIYGEVVDLLNGRGTDEPGPVRTVGVCSSHTVPVPELLINSPESIAGVCAAGAAQFGPQLDQTGVTGDVVLGDDGVTDPAPTGTTTDACTPLINGDEILGNVALVDRGSCAFTIKVKNAQDAGAIAVVVADNLPGPPSGMAGDDPTIVIPSLRITLDHGNLIKGELTLGSTVNVTLKAKGGATPEDSYRWLVGEDATAFGGAIRDMWEPTCLSDPGKVTDAEYHCGSDDQGGVHTNSGVPNHGFALLVDGGTYNSHTIGAIGMVKASHLYFRAMTVYQTPTTDFPDHADALEASCTDLIGLELEGLSTTDVPAGPSGESITAEDCGQVTEMIAAVELRTDPSIQCNFQPILQQGEPDICADADSTETVFADDFEDGLGDWTLTNEGVFAGWPGIDWVQDTSLPGDRAGAAAFAADPDIGNCDGGAGDVSGSLSMESPDIAIPAVEGAAPRLTFDHYIATEANFDGGNVKLSVNGGPFTLVPTSAFTFNPYNVAVLQETNPLAPDPGFSGTDGGVTAGSWGQSQVDLAALGVVPGDTVNLRYDFGMDGCAGIDGWYVDDVTVVLCVFEDVGTLPTIEVAPGGTTDSDDTATMNLLVGDDDPDAVTLSGVSSDQQLVSNGGITFGGSGADRTVTIDAADKKSGTAVVTVTATDADGNTATVDITVHLGTNRNDKLNGDDGADLFFGRDGNDRISGRGGNDLASAGRGADLVNGQAGHDTVGGGQGDDELTGADGNDDLRGDGGNDSLFGGAQDDFLTGGTGADFFSGGPGTDTNTDFNAGEGDTTDGT